jgi:hypothetical protein
MSRTHCFINFENEFSFINFENEFSTTIFVEDSLFVTLFLYINNNNNNILMELCFRSLSHVPKL